MSGLITYGERTLEYQLLENAALSNKIRIHVHPDGTVEVESPPGKSKSDITQAVLKRANWITQRLDEAAVFRKHAIAREYVSGETHFYLGRRYQLKVVEQRERLSSVKMAGGQIRVELPVIDRVAVKRRLHDWYKRRASTYLKKRLFEVQKTIPWVIESPPLKLGDMRKQWGSCSPTGTINLNHWLIRAPRECIDYVIVHELCHLQEHNHSKRFYALLDKHFVDWRKVKGKLDGMSELLLAD